MKNKRAILHKYNDSCVSVDYCGPARKEGNRRRLSAWRRLLFIVINLPPRTYSNFLADDVTSLSL